MCKVKIEDEDIYENDWGSVLLYRCRTNSLRLNWRECFVSGNVNCGVCEASVEETLEHFLCDCKWYDVVRLEHGMMGHTGIFTIKSLSSRAEFFLNFGRNITAGRQNAEKLKIPARGRPFTHLSL